MLSREPDKFSLFLCLFATRWMVLASLPVSEKPSARVSPTCSADMATAEVYFVGFDCPHAGPAAAVAIASTATKVFSTCLIMILNFYLFCFFSFSVNLEVSMS